MNQRLQRSCYGLQRALQMGAMKDCSCDSDSQLTCSLLCTNVLRRSKRNHGNRRKQGRRAASTVLDDARGSVLASAKCVKNCQETMKDTDRSCKLGDTSWGYAESDNLFRQLKSLSYRLADSPDGCKM
jgi:hypothetical protein